ncbi:Rv3235 family protein [Streptomyces sp. NPDC057877]|uniref:Rv3235 family protein n=1 Tax=Streptomyces sp. NPDC057877 TaxID=3346269 RepID=UPI0036BE21D5
MYKITTRTASAARSTTGRPTATRPPGRRDTRRPSGPSRSRPSDSRPPTPPRRAAARPEPPRPTPPRPDRPTDVFADRLLTVLSGRRPVHWMLGHTAGRAYDELAHLAEHGPLRPRPGVRAVHPVIRDIGYFEPRPGALEAFARILTGSRLRAMAFRLEQGTDLRWRCTAVELDGPRPARRHDD